MVADIRVAFRKAHIPYHDIGSNGDTVQVRVTDASRTDEAAKLIDGISPTMQSSVLSVGAKEYDVTQPGGGLFSLRMTDGYKTQTHTQVMEQSERGGAPPHRRNGHRRAEHRAIGRRSHPESGPRPAGSHPAEGLVGQDRFKATFRLVDESADPNAEVVPIGDEILPVMNKDKNAPVRKDVLQSRVMVSGDRLTDAGAGFDQQTGQPVVTFRFDSVGAREFGDVTKNNVHHRFAIVLDKEILTDPNIQEAILGGSGQITGSFTTQSANDLGPSCCAPAPCRRGSTSSRNGHRRRRAWRRSGESRQLFRHRRIGAGGAVHDWTLWPVRSVRRYRAHPQHRAAAGGADPVHRYPDLKGIAGISKPRN